MAVQDFLYPPVPGITGAIVLTEDTLFTARMRGKVIGLAGFTLTLAALPPAKFGAFYVEGPGEIAGEIEGELSAGQAALIVVRDGGFSWGQAAVISVAGKSGAVSLVVADITGLVAALNQRLRHDPTITGLIGGGPDKLDGIITAGGAVPLRSIVRVEVPEIGRLDYILVAGDEEVEAMEGYEPHFVLPADYDFETNNVAWVLAPANVSSQFAVRPLLNTTLGGTFSMWNKAHTGAIVIHAHNCDAGTDAVEFTKAGVVAMLEDVQARALAAETVFWNPGLVHRPGSHLGGLRNATGITRIRSGGAVAVSASSDLAVTRITGFSGVDPNASWIPAHLWQEDRPTWRLSGQGLGYLISRSAAGLWEIKINNTLALRGGTAGLEFPWQEVVWYNSNGYGYTGGGPLIVPDAATPVELVPPHLLPPERVYPLVDAATVTPDFAAAKFFSITIGGNRTLANPLNVSPGGYLVRVKQDGTGGRTLSFGDRYRFSGGVPPVLTAAAGAEDILSIVNFGGNELYLAVNSNMLPIP